ncbi:MAG: efflux RND transporter permease subunit, partial [Anaerolineae bacterium]
GDVARVEVASTMTAIHREAISRRVDVSFSVHGRDPRDVARDVEGTLKQLEFPRESHAKLMGEFAERRAGRVRVLMAGIVALIGVYLLLQAAFDSWRLATLVLLVLPCAMAGGVVAALVLGRGVLSLGESVGFVTILGNAVRNSIMLIRQYGQLEKEDGELSQLCLVLRGSRECAVPILVTALAIGLVLLPFVVGGDVPGHEMAYPMAVVVLAGLVSSTVLSLLVMPTLYLRLGGARLRPESQDC